MRAKITYGVIPHGQMAGVPALWLRPKATGGERGFTEVMQTLIESFKVMNMHFRLLALDVRNEPFNEGEIGEVVQLLDWAFMNKVGVVHYAHAMQPPSYLRMGGIVKMKVGGSEPVNLKGIPVGELYWYPNGEQPDEPEIEGADSAARYIAVNASFPSSEAYRFLTNTAQKPWAVALSMRGVMEVEL